VLIWIILLVGNLAAGVVMGLLFLAYRSPRFSRYRISDDPHRAMPDERVRNVVLFNLVFSPGLIVAVCYFFGDTLFYDHATPWWLMVVEGVVAGVIYDFGYYFLHRYPFHEWRLLRDQHALHHAARNPTPLDAMMVHPYEMWAGILLFFGSIAAVGGMHLYTFGVAFTVFTVLNVFNHAGINVPHGPLKVIGALSVKHDRHHHSMLCGNYASITPLPDLVFGTVE